MIFTLLALVRGREIAGSSYTTRGRGTINLFLGRFFLLMLADYRMTISIDSWDRTCSLFWGTHLKFHSRLKYQISEL